MKLEHFLTPYTKVNSKWVKDLNVRPETLKLLEKNIGKTLSNINHSRILYDPPPRILEIKAKINKWDLIKLKSFCTTKETISKVKRQPSDWEKITANETTDKGLLSKNVFNKGQNPLLFISFLVTHCETPKTCGNIHPLIYYQCLGAIVIIISTVHPVQKLNICQNLISAEILILNTTFVNYDLGKR